MTIEFTGEITGLTRKDIGSLKKVCTKVHWKMTGTSSGSSHSVEGVHDLPAPDPDDFTEYDNLAESDVRFGWLRQSQEFKEELHRVQQVIKAELEKESEELSDVPW